MLIKVLDEVRLGLELPGELGREQVLDASLPVGVVRCVFHSRVGRAFNVNVRR